MAGTQGGGGPAGVGLDEIIDAAGAEAALEDAAVAKIGRAVQRGGGPGLADAGAAVRASVRYHMELMLLGKSARHADREGRERERAIVLAGRKCSAVLEACPVPDDPVERMGHTLMLIANACVGERPEAARRYLEENARAWDTVGADAGRNLRALADVYTAVLLMASKGSREDLERAAGIAARAAGGGERPGGIGEGRGAADELAALRLTAESAREAAAFMLGGSPADVEARRDARFRDAVDRGIESGIGELDVLLSLVHAALVKMTRNSPWMMKLRGGRKSGEFAGMLAGRDLPVLELSFPQRAALAEGWLIDPGRGGAVACLPGPARALAAEFRILEALETARGGTAAWVAPDEAAAGRLAARLRRDLGGPPLGVSVERAGGAPCADGFDEDAISSGARADVLVAAPEKMLALLRQPGCGLAGSLALAVIDGADGIPGGPALEILVCEIKRGCPRADLLVLASSEADARAVAEWLDPGNPRAIAAGAGWRPNDLAVGVLGAARRGGRIVTSFRPLAAGGGTVSARGRFRVGSAGGGALPAGKAGRRALASLLATQFDPSQGLLVLGGSRGEAWRIADLICRGLPEPEPDAWRLLAGRFVAAELGGGFPLVRHLARGVGVCHGGLPCEVRELMARLMEGGRLRALVATPGIARGIDFPASVSILASRPYGGGRMPARDFWNLAGWTGRIDQPAMGVVGMVARDRADAARWSRYARRAPGDLESSLEGMVRGALEGGGALDLSRLAAADAGWSRLARYIAGAAGRGAGRAAEEAGLAVRRTYGYLRLQPAEREALEDAARRYAGRPGAGGPPGAAGFPAEALEGAARAARAAGIGSGDWSAEALFSSSSEKLPALLGAMEGIPGVGERLRAPSASGRTAPVVEIAWAMSGWASGAGIEEMARAHFGGGREGATDCAEAVCGDAAGAAALGLACIMGIPGVGPDLGGMSRGERRSALNLPAMVCCGADSDEAVLMRRYGVPRRAARRVGAAYAREGREIRAGPGIMRWLEELPDDAWRPLSGPAAPGADYKEVWRALAGAAGGRGP